DTWRIHTFRPIPSRRRLGSMTERPELRGTGLFDLTGRVALITGAGRGLGRTMSLALAAAGADVVLASRTATELESLAAEAKDLGREAHVITCDITSEESVDRMIAGAIEAAGKVEIRVNNAGINIRKPVLELSAEEYDSVFRTNLRGYCLCARAAGRHMVERGSGKVINV